MPDKAHPHAEPVDRKSTRLNSSHPSISYAVFCLKKKIHFLDPGYINSQTLTESVVYKYAFSAKNNGALTYDHNRITYLLIFFFFNDTATTEIYTLSLHDALPI